MFYQPSLQQKFAWPHASSYSSQASSKNIFWQKFSLTKEISYWVFLLSGDFVWRTLSQSRFFSFSKNS